MYKKNIEKFIIKFSCSILMFGMPIYASSHYSSLDTIRNPHDLLLVPEKPVKPIYDFNSSSDTDTPPTAGTPVITAAPSLIDGKDSEAPVNSQTYINNYSDWKNDGMRFFSQEFIEKWRMTGVIPELRDGRPELSDWLDLTEGGNVFEMDWGISRPDALIFLERMANAFGDLTENVKKILENAKFSITS